MGKAFFKRFVLEMDKRGVSIFKVVVGEKLCCSIKFYEKLGFVLYKSFSITASKHL